MRVILAAAGAAAALAGCGGGEAETVVAAFYPLAFAAERVAGDGVEVRNLTPAGAEPHDLELSPADVGEIADAKLVVYAGAGFQPAVEDAVASTGAEALDVLEGLELHATGEEHEGEDGEESADPHVWLDPRRYARVVERIAAALGRPDAAGPLVAELGRLDAEFERGLATCARHELVTSHAAFGYLADRYRLEQVALSGLSPEAEPSPAALSDVVAEVRERGATTVYFETLVSPRLAETVAREVGAATAVLNPLEGLTPEQADRGEDYFSVMRENLAALRRGLGCR